MKLCGDFLHQALPDAVLKKGTLRISNDDAWFKTHTSEVGVSIDTRTLQPGEFFVPLKGPNFDGHSFIKDALTKGACGSLLSKEHEYILETLPQGLITNKLFVVVSDTLIAFIALAKTWRSLLTCPVVGITGSVGKTTTKEMLRSIVQAAGINAHVSIKTYNNVFGVCHTILRAPRNTQALIMEIGINACGEMAELVDIVRPDIGAITCIAHAHLEGLGNSLTTVAQEKRKLFTHFTSKNIGIIFGDQELLTDVYYAHPIAKFGLKTKNQVQARKVNVECDKDGNLTTKFIFKWYNQRTILQLSGNHPGFVNNALAAATIAYFLHLPYKAVVDGLQNYRGTEQRFEIKKLKNNKGIVLNDCYNANPESMKAAIAAFSQFTLPGKRIAVLGDMLELGTKESYWHRQIGRAINKHGGIDSLILVGERAREIASTIIYDFDTTFVPNWQQAHAYLEQHLQNIAQNALILVKASHGMSLHHMVNKLIDE